MKHFATRRFWDCYRALDRDAQHLADKQFALLKENPEHPSLRLKKVGTYWSIRVSLRLRALAVEDTGDFVWWWIGNHDDYLRLVDR